MTVTTSRADCYGWGACGVLNRVVVWDAECGCWCAKCCHCGMVEHGSCTDGFVGDHWDDFEDSAIALVEGGWRG